MTGIAGFAVGAFLTAAIFGLVHLCRGGRIGPRALIAAAVLCSCVFILLNVSDWPTGVLAPFWRDHAMIASTAGTLLLVGVGYFAFEAQDRHLQDRYDTKIAGAGRAGVVDHLIDIDVTLALAMGSRDGLEDLWPNWNQAGRPLRWLRDHRHVLNTDAGVAVLRDPRAWPPPIAVGQESWRQILVDQAVRRMMSGIRDWSVVLARSRAGQRDLVDLGQLRLDLLRIEEALRQGQAAGIVGLILACQARARSLAYRFEKESEAQPRSELMAPSPAQ